MRGPEKLGSFKKFLEKVKKTTGLEGPVERKYNFKEIAELEKPIENLVGQLKEAIDSGKYDTLIGDDASGRIPTLILRKVILERFRKLHPDATPEQEREAVKTFFIAGGYAKNNEELRKFFSEKLKNNVTKKVLFITEAIVSGSTVNRVIRLLEGEGISSDVAAVESPYVPNKESADIIAEIFKGLGLSQDAINKAVLNDAVENRPDYLRDTKAEIFSGDTSGRVPSIKEKYSLGGVEKDSRSSSTIAHAVPSFPSSNEGFSPASIEKTRKRVTDAREDVNLMASKILKEVWKEK